MPDARAHTGQHLTFTFVAAVTSLLVVFIAVGSTIPLFNIYRAEEGFTHADISMTVVAYSAATLAMLMVLGRLSNHVGRRPVAIASLLLLLLGSVLLLEVHDSWVLITGRLLMGLGAGLGSSSLSAYIVDAAPARPAWLAAVASSQSVMVGLAIGGVLSGALVQFGPWRRTLIFVVVIALIVLSMTLIVVSQETVAQKPGAWQSMHPRVRAPSHVRPLLAVAIAVLLATWATGSFYQAFVPAILEDQLSSTSPLVIGLVFGAYMGPSVGGAMLGGRISPARAQRLGMLGFLVGTVGIVAAIVAGALLLFIGATVVAGLSQGVAITATVRALLDGSSLLDRAPIFSVIYLISYSAATIPALIAGQLSKTFSLSEITLGYGALALISTLITIAARNHEPGRIGGPAND